MRYLFLGLLAGIALAFVPFGLPTGGIELYPEWQGRISAPAEIEPSKRAGIGRIALPPVRTPGSVFLLSGSGELLNQAAAGNSLFSVSGNGKYLALFEKAGKSVEFFDIRGERFWKIKSREYPYLSHSGKTLLLLNGDQSRIRIVDYNGNEIGGKEIGGRFCTVIAFSRHSDYACAGFMDGTYWLIGPKGEIVRTDKIPGNAIIKSMAVSANGKFMAVHYGLRERDFIRIVHADTGKSYAEPLKYIHLVKIALYSADDGRAAALDYDRLLFLGKKAGVDVLLPVKAARPGFAKIDSAHGLYGVGYTARSGEALFLLYRGDGVLLFSRSFPEESIMDASMEDALILLRGSNNLYCYSYPSRYIP